MSACTFDVVKTAYMRNLIKLRILQETTPDSIIRIPRDYCSDSILLNKVSWSLNAASPDSSCIIDSVPGSIYMHIIPIEHRTWGDANWQWQVCVSTGGVLSILTNYCETKICPPEVNKTYVLHLNIQ